jgi:hypothetical protein
MYSISLIKLINSLNLHKVLSFSLLNLYFIRVFGVFLGRIPF